ncbi:ER lumen protein-retaining receptor [Mycena kentingensis (nom. inval.)]|nr:ER lumen protein-retaining receptor [Mycena kentingensis (nom. inval.)]
MKRGFLKSQKATTRPLGPSLGGTGTPATSWTDGHLAGSEPIVMRLPFEKLGKKVELPANAAKNTGHWSGRTVQPSEALSSTDYTLRLTRVPPFENAVEPTTECLFKNGVSEMLYKIPNFPHPLPRLPSAKPAFRLAESPGRGLGLFSTRVLKQGDAILVERPLLITPAAYPSSTPNHYTLAQHFQHTLNEFERGVERVMEGMEPKHKKALMALYNSHTDDGSGPLVGRIRTNGIGVSELTPGKDDAASIHSATCELLSRLNHSCSPNTQPKFDLESFSFTLYAVRDIPEGDELTFQYIEAPKTTAERNKSLRPYGFQCSCSACNDPTSDTRRALVGKFSPTVSAWVHNRTLPDDWLINKCTELIELLETEGLEYVERYFMATSAIMQSYIALGDAEAAGKWAKRLTAITWAPKHLVELFGGNRRLEAIANAESGACEKDGLWRARVDENAQGEEAQMLKLIAELAGPDGMKVLEGGQGLFSFNAPAPGSDLEKRFKQFVEGKGLGDMMKELKL